MSNISEFTLCKIVSGIKKKDFTSEEVTESFIKNSKKSKKLNVYITNCFDEAISSNPFFRKGELNEWEKLLNKEIKNKIESNFGREMKELGYKCDCIRCREIKQTKFDIDDIEYDYLNYDTKNNINYFISANYNTKLVGFLRLSIKKKKIKTLDVLDDASVVRELHIYGKMKATYLSNNSNSQKSSIG